MSEPMIEAVGLTKVYGETLAVSGVSFSAARGETLGLLGANGSGKTTTMRILTGATPASRGANERFFHQFRNERSRNSEANAMSADKPVLGIDLGGTKILALAAAPDGDVLASAVSETPSKESAERIISAMTDAARAAMREAGLSSDDVGSAGVAAAGAIDVREGAVVHSPHLAAMSNTPVAAMLSRQLGLPVVIGNDANLAALGEQRFGAGKGVSDLLFLTISTGIGGGIIIGGKLFTGSAGYAGEVGHVTVDAHGPFGASSTPGAWESLCSGTALARIATERIAAGERSSMSGALRDVNQEGLTARDVFAAQRSGDALAQSVVADAVVYLGAGLTSLVNLLNPGKIIIGGGLSNEWDAYVAPAVALMREQSFAGVGKLTPVVPPALGAEAGALGAVSLACDAQP